MSLKITIFEDDKDLADSLKELMSFHNFEVLTCFKIAGTEWREADVVIGDFRNKIVSFSSLREECASEGIPLIAISGADTGYHPQLLKPFTTEDLKSAIYESLVLAKEMGLVRKNLKSESLLDSLSAWLKG